jgi:hypothetical protein
MEDSFLAMAVTFWFHRCILLLNQLQANRFPLEKQARKAMLKIFKYCGQNDVENPACLSG